VYAIFIDDPAELPTLTIPLEPNHSDGLIYIGMTHSVRDHFDCRSSGFSTLRRSLGALLKKKLALRATYRGRGNSEADFTNYRFEEDSEAVLTRWMKAHLCISFVALSEGRELTEDQEEQLIEKLNPPLNLTHSTSPDVKAIKALRAVCAKEARLAKSLSKRQS
jgi:hypothetical protein